MNKEVCWSVGGGQGSFGKRCVGGDVGKCVGVWGGGKERCVGRVWKSVCRYGVSEKACWRVGKECGEGNGRDLGKCVGPQHTFNSPRLLPTLTFPYISPYFPHTPSHFPTTPLIPLPTSPLPPPIPQHMFLLSPHLPSPSHGVAKLPCDEVSVAKLPSGEVTGNHLSLV